MTCAHSVVASAVIGSVNASLVGSVLVCVVVSSGAPDCVVVCAISVGALSGTSGVVCDCTGAGIVCVVEAVTGFVVASEAVKRVVVALVAFVVVAFVVVEVVAAVGFAVEDVGFVVAETVGT